MNEKLREFLVAINKCPVCDGRWASPDGRRRCDCHVNDEVMGKILKAALRSAALYREPQVLVHVDGDTIRPATKEEAEAVGIAEAAGEADCERGPRIIVRPYANRKDLP